MFFIFPDLAVRSPGTYQFRLSLYHIGKPQSSVVAHELSRTFEIVSPKNYPGPSGELIDSRTYASRCVSCPARCRSAHSLMQLHIFLKYSILNLMKALSEPYFCCAWSPEYAGAMDPASHIANKTTASEKSDFWLNQCLEFQVC
ncbi:hypothetical protein EDD86DRAFT_16563 [Gorgonomyces haynaldii]|nr:hypothetical protein EDD86DRAFT_16563 [Gorgonomyces haynaldii]